MARLLNDQNQCIRASATLIVHLITDQHYHATAASHYTHSLSVTFLCPPPDCRRARLFIALTGRAHACPLPGANNAPPQRQLS